MNSFLIVGHGGRESAFAVNLARDSRVYAVCAHENPTIAQCCQQSGGVLSIGDVEDAESIARFAGEHKIDYAFVNADGPLSCGVVDALMRAGVRTVGPTREAARIEWDKIFSIEVVDSIFPQYCPRYKLVENDNQALEAVNELCADGGALVVKPQGLTGGKGVKVMGEHLQDSDAAIDYTRQLLSDDGQSRVLLVEKLDGIEFTLMGVTDGVSVVGTPITYDYPYRFDGDHGPGTGGMGCFTDCDQPIFFLNQKEYDACLEILTGVVRHLGERGLHFSGVLNGGFFLTQRGLYFMEFNARIGDPEGINILSLMNGSLSELLSTIHARELHPNSLSLSDHASVVKYLVSPSYPASGSPINFTHDTRAFADSGISTFFASARAGKSDNQFASVSSSRIVALSALDKTVELAAKRINRAVNAYADQQLEFRADIGLGDSLDRLRERAAAIRQNNDTGLPVND